MTVFSSEFKFAPTDETSAREFLQWEYDPPYTIYNPLPDRFDEDLAYHITLGNHIYSMYRDDELVGYCGFGRDAQVSGGDYFLQALDIGMMIKPELTGRGQGHIYADAVIQYGISKFQPKRLRVTILGSNLRAIKVWKKNGFKEIQSFDRTGGQLGFVVMTKEI